MTMSTNVIDYHYHYDQHTTSQHINHKNLDNCRRGCWTEQVDMAACQSGLCS